MVKEIKGQIVTLRDLTDADLNDYRKWFTKGLEWTKWDAPWEEMSDKHAQNFIQRLSNKLSKGPQEIRTRFEIEVDSTHIGWVSSYHIERNPGFLAVGISIPEEDFWAKGIGKEALQLLRAKFRTFDSVGPVWAARAAGTAGEDIEQFQRAAFEDATDLFRSLDAL